MPEYLKATFSPDANAGYIHLVEPGKARHARSKEMAAMIVVDYDAGGKAIGIEILVDQKVEG